MSSELPVSSINLPVPGDEHQGPDYVKIEKNIASLGIFSALTAKPPSTKTITVTRIVEEKRIRATVTIANAHGIPTTAHQDRTLAFMKLLEIRRQGGEEIVNPVGFHSADLLRILNLGVQSGKNYEDIDQWLDVMTSTSIKSEQAIYLASKRGLASADRFHIFERSISFSGEMPDGSKADKNYVWLADWLLDNIKSGYLLSLDLDAYNKLNNPIAKVLAIALHVWLYASEKEGFFQKRYSEFCEYLGIREYPYLSKIKEKLSPALEELVTNRYLASWEVRRGSEEFVIQVVPGPKYFEDRRSLTTRKETGISAKTASGVSSTKRINQATREREGEIVLAETLQETDYDLNLVRKLVSEGVGESAAIRLAKEKPEESRRQLGFLPHQTIKNNRGGFLSEAILKSYGPPPAYEEAEKKKLIEEQKKARQKAQEARRAKEGDHHEYLLAQEKKLAESHSEAFAAYEAGVASIRATLNPEKQLDRLRLRFFDSDEVRLKRFVEYFSVCEPPLVVDLETWMKE